MPAMAGSMGLLGPLRPYAGYSLVYGSTGPSRALWPAIGLLGPLGPYAGYWSTGPYEGPNGPK